jgi:hypothetical protein
LVSVNSGAPAVRAFLSRLVRTRKASSSRLRASSRRWASRVARHLGDQAWRQPRQEAVRGRPRHRRCRHRGGLGVVGGQALGPRGTGRGRGPPYHQQRAADPRPARQRPNPVAISDQNVPLPRGPADLTAGAAASPPRPRTRRRKRPAGYDSEALNWGNGELQTIARARAGSSLRGPRSASETGCLGPRRAAPTSPASCARREGIE